MDGFTRSYPIPLGGPPSSLEMQAGIRQAKGSWLTQFGSPNPCLRSQGLLFADGAICLGRTPPKCWFGSPTSSRLQLLVRAGDSRQRRTVGSARSALNGGRKRLKTNEGADDCGGRGEYGSGSKSGTNGLTRLFWGGRGCDIPLDRYLVRPHRLLGRRIRHRLRRLPHLRSHSGSGIPSRPVRQA